MINPEVVNGIKDSLGNLLTDYAKEIETAIVNEGAVAVSLPVKIKQTGSDLDVEVGIGFIKEKVKDSIGFTISGQKELFDSNDQA